MNYFQLLSIIIFLNVKIFTKKISIPFKFRKIERRYLHYKTKTFLNEYFKNDLILELNIGSPPLKLDCLLNQYSSYFNFINIDLDTKPIINGYYTPYKSSSFSLEANTANDLFYFNNEKYNLNFLMNVNKTNSFYIYYNFIPEIGLNASSTNLIYDLKRKDIISQNMFTIKYSNNLNEEEGEFIIGEDLCECDLFYSNNYTYIKSYFKNNFSFEMNSIYASDNNDEINNKIINDNISQFYQIEKKRKGILNINSGFIIGTEDFMNYIEDIYFKELIEKNICLKHLAKLNEDNKGTEYYIYNCYESMLKGVSSKMYAVNYYERFPKIIFNSNTLGKYFELQKEDLFKAHFSKFYFLIIFQKSNNSSQKDENDIWYLGQPFIKKYPFSINYDSKTIGFYFKKDKEKEIIENTKNKIEKMENYTKIKTIIKYIGIILISLGALYAAYYIGLKAREKRRKRANEMKDDDFEYIPEKIKDINEIEDNNKNQKLLELNSKLNI